MKKSEVSSGYISIDCTQIPKTPKKLILKEHKDRGIANFNLCRLATIPVSSKFKKGEACIRLDEVIRRFNRNRTNVPANANILEYVSKHFQEIPKKYSKPGVYLLFVSTTYLTKNEELCIRALNYAGDGWSETILFNGDNFAVSDLVVCIK